MNFRPDRWLYGLPALALLWIAAMLDATPRIERELRRDLAQPSGTPSVAEPARPRPQVDGRDVVVVAEPGVPPGALAEAEAAARAVEGVRRVRTEEALTVPMTPFRLTFTRGPGGITLSGGVPSPALRAALVAAATALVGADAVEDGLKLATGEPDGLAAAARALIAALAHVAIGEASLVDRALSFKGEATGPAAYDAALAALAAPPAGYAVRALDVTPPKLDPYRWEAVRSADAVVLRGAVPSPALQAGLLDSARKRFPGLAVRDEMGVWRGLDPAIDFSRLTEGALAALAKLASGRVELAGRRLGLSGEGVARDLMTGLDGELRRALPDAVEFAPAAIRIVPASPFGFSASRAGGRVHADGLRPGRCRAPHRS